jgi:hypothetical protein
MEEFLYYLVMEIQYNSYVSLSLIALVILLILGRVQKLKFDSYWHQMLYGFSYSPKDFYYKVEKELRKKSIDGIQFNLIELKKGGLFSGKRVYLRITWKTYIYDICCTPIGDSVFISWYSEKRLGFIPKLISAMPLIGRFLIKRFYPITYYTIDLENMFVTYAHQAILSVLNEITEESHISLTDKINKPVLKNIFKR